MRQTENLQINQMTNINCTNLTRCQSYSISSLPSDWRYPFLHKSVKAWRYKNKLFLLILPRVGWTNNFCANLSWLISGKKFCFFVFRTFSFKTCRHGIIFYSPDLIMHFLPQLLSLRPSHSPSMHEIMVGPLGGGGGSILFTILKLIVNLSN